VCGFPYPLVGRDGPDRGDSEGGKHAARGKPLHLAARGGRVLPFVQRRGRRGGAAVGGAREAAHQHPRAPRHRPARPWRRGGRRGQGGGGR
jgi:hypothetical protein